MLELLGHPLKLASSYKARRYLIGPALYPAYLQTLKIALISVLSVIVLASVVFGSANSWPLLAKGVLNSFFEAGLWVAAMVTLAFLALESSEEGLEWYDHWTPKDLRRDTRALNYSDVVANLVSEGFFLLWWNGLILNTWSVTHSWDFDAQLSPIWQVLFWPLNILIAVFFVLHVVVLVRGTWQRSLSLLELLLCGALLVAIGALLSNQPLVVFESGSAAAPWVERTLSMILWGIAALTVWDGVLAYRRLR